MSISTGKSSYRKTELHSYLISILFLTGFALRLFHYLYNRSLWMDEVYLSPSLLRMNYSDLATHMLDYQQKAPIGFLWMVKFSVNTFGANEMALRLIPFLCGLLSLILFHKICKYYLSPYAHIIAFSIFVFSPAIIYHSVEIKQYATECLATLVAIYLCTKYENTAPLKSKLIWGISGGLTLWFSFSVIFILTGLGAGLTAYYLFTKNWQQLKKNLLPFTIWGFSFLLNYVLFTHKHSESQWVVYWFKTYDNFLPLPPHNIAQLKWFPRNFIQMMDYPLGLVWDLKSISNMLIFKLLAMPVLPSLLLFTGILYTLKINKKALFIFITPILLTLFASGIYLYPLLERFWIFLAPVLILFIAIGFEYYKNKIKRPAFTFVLGLLLICGPMIQSAYYTLYPEKFYKHKKSYVKESFMAVNKNFESGDAVYIYWNNTPGYCVYRKIQQFKYNAIVGHDFRKTSANLDDYNQHLKTDFNQFANKKRVWVLCNTQFLTNIGDLVDDPRWYYKNEMSPNQNLLFQLKKEGKIIRELVYSDVTVYLLELHSSN